MNQGNTDQGNTDRSNGAAPAARVKPTWQKPTLEQRKERRDQRVREIMAPINGFTKYLWFAMFAVAPDWRCLPPILVVYYWSRYSHLIFPHLEFTVFSRHSVVVYSLVFVWFLVFFDEAEREEVRAALFG